MAPKFPFGKGRISVLPTLSTPESTLAALVAQSDICLDFDVFNARSPQERIEAATLEGRRLQKVAEQITSLKAPLPDALKECTTALHREIAKARQELGLSPSTSTQATPTGSTSQLPSVTPSITTLREKAPSPETESEEEYHETSAQETSEPPPPESPEDTALAASLSRTNTTSVSDRKSTRLNSSHSSISYAVFCLKKKKKT